MATLILGSSSLRRIEAIEKMGLPYQVISIDFNERIHQASIKLNAAEQIAVEKMKQLLQEKSILIKGEWTLTADTLVHTGSLQLGKPENRQEANKMLKELSGKKHYVTTAVCIKDREDFYEVFSETSEVYFRKLNDSLISFYLDLGEWEDAAGSYKIQESGDLLIDRINGSFSNVMGLPLRLIYDILLSKGFFKNS